MTPVTASSTEVILDMPSITQRLKSMVFPAVDHVVGIATGGTVPASLIAYHLEVPLSLLHINYRAASNQPQRQAPELLQPLDIPPSPSRILLVDDVCVTGATLAFASRLLENRTVTTCVLKGTADLVAFPEIQACVRWPWKL